MLFKEELPLKFNQLICPSLCLVWEEMARNVVESS